MLIRRTLHLDRVKRLLGQFPVVAILGARQIGKTTLASEIQKGWKQPSQSFDLESPGDLGRLADPDLALRPLKGLVVLDEIGRGTATFDGLRIGAADEIALAKQLLNFGVVLEAVGEEYRPNFLCNYLYDLSGLLSRFWENCPVLKSAEPERTSRLVLTNLTGSVLKQGLNVLGIETTEQM